MTDAIKIGGSLMKYPEKLKQLTAGIERLSTKHKMIIIPGGGAFADSVRAIDKKFHFSPSTSHKMAILAMDQYGLYLSELLPRAKVVQSLSDAKRSGFAILIPSQILLKVSEKELPHSWDVTSDSIACYIAQKVKAEKLVLVKAVDGIYMAKKLMPEVKAGELNDKKNCVDKMLPRLLIKYRVDCHIVSGFHPDRLQRVLDGKPAISTLIKH